jgi:hypothetical protein
LRMMTFWGEHSSSREVSANSFLRPVLGMLSAAVVQARGGGSWCALRQEGVTGGPPQPCIRPLLVVERQQKQDAQCSCCRRVGEESLCDRDSMRISSSSSSTLHSTQASH